MNKYDLEKSVDSECVGGGRVKVDKENKSIFVYGYSQGKKNFILFLNNFFNIKILEFKLNYWNLN